MYKFAYFCNIPGVSTPKAPSTDAIEEVLNPIISITNVDVVNHTPTDTKKKKSPTAWRKSPFVIAAFCFIAIFAIALLARKIDRKIRKKMGLRRKTTIISEQKPQYPKTKKLNKKSKKNAAFGRNTNSKELESYLKGHNKEGGLGEPLLKDKN